MFVCFFSFFCLSGHGVLRGCFFLFFFFSRHLNAEPHYSWTHTHTSQRYMKSAAAHIQYKQVVDVLRKWCEDIGCANNKKNDSPVSLMSPLGETGNHIIFSYSPNNTFCRCCNVVFFRLSLFFSLRLFIAESNVWFLSYKMSRLSCSSFCTREGFGVGGLGMSATSESFAEGSVLVVLDCKIHATLTLGKKEKKKKKRIICFWTVTVLTWVKLQFVSKMNFASVVCRVQHIQYCHWEMKMFVYWWWKDTLYDNHNCANFSFSSLNKLC